jgi:predicted DNA-binding transcriptional regulator YafY
VSGFSVILVNVRADRLLSLLLLLQHRGRLSATELAQQLEVSTRTVLRDVEALSAAGVPVYAERGRHGGFALVPGYSTDLTGLTHNEALALLVAGSRPDGAGMAPALASAMRKVVAGLPAAQRESAGRDAGRILVHEEGWLPDARQVSDALDEERLAVVRGAVFAGRRLDIRYAARDEEPRWRTVDPVGLVNASGRWYLLALRDGEERTYRLSRVREVRERDEPAARPADLDLDRVWREHRAAFPASRPGVAVAVRVSEVRRDALVRTARAVSDEEPESNGWLRLTVEFGDAAHAEGVLWSLGADVEVLAPADLRATLASRVEAMAARYGHAVAARALGRAEFAASSSTAPTMDLAALRADQDAVADPGLEDPYAR